MSTCYERWFEREEEWIKKQRKRQMQRAGVYCLILPFALSLISLVSGLSSGASDFWKGMPASFLIGIVMGLVIWIGISLSNPVKRYGKNIKKLLEDLSQTERENMAKQMLGEDPDIEVRELSWKSWSEGVNIARVTKDYLTFSCDKGAFQIVQLWKTERIELDVREDTYRARGGGMTVRVSDESYPMSFYYRGNQTQQSNEAYVFGKRAWRDEVLRAIRELSGEDSLSDMTQL
ncbi:MAG: hypothetical protein HDR13_12785 [Lachnospiraceae bacterium]|nr:hypothetical protein [Lachnospiraceae bacterium]